MCKFMCISSNACDAVVSSESPLRVHCRLDDAAAPGVSCVGGEYLST